MLLEKDAAVYGLALYGDGATVKRMPLLNILASGAHLTTAVLEITDCTGHMSAGGKKDATYIARLFEPHLKTLDPTKKVVDLLYFDGASNVQKAGQILCAKYPRVTCLHGAEHVVSLFFDDISKLPAIKSLINFYKKVYGLFGSGAHHAPHAILMNHSRLHNKGKSIGLIRAADTRMAGYIIAFLRLLRQKPVIDSTVAAPEFIRLEVETSLVNILKKPEYWKGLLLITRAVFAPLRVLRLADQKVC
jgi:hypothetical protein